MARGKQSAKRKISNRNGNAVRHVTFNFLQENTEIMAIALEILKFVHGKPWQLNLQKEF